MRVSFLCACVCGLSLLGACGGTVVLGEATGGDANGADPGSTSTGAAGDEGPPTGGRGSGRPTGGVGTGGVRPTGSGGVREGTGGVQQPGSGGVQGGTGGEVASCDRNVTPCGGDVVGTWNVTSSCLNVSGTMDLSMLGLGCSSGQITKGFLEVSGAWTAYADGTYADDTRVSGREELELPDDCLYISGTTTTCSLISIVLYGVGYDQAACVDNSATGGCTCSAAVNQNGGLGVAPIYDPRAAGYYGAVENTITITPKEQEYSYCVAGTTLAVTPRSTDTTGTLTGIVVLEKQ